MFYEPLRWAIISLLRVYHPAAPAFGLKIVFVSHSCIDMLGWRTVLAFFFFFCSFARGSCLVFGSKREGHKAGRVFFCLAAGIDAEFGLARKETCWQC